MKVQVHYKLFRRQAGQWLFAAYVISIRAACELSRDPDNMIIAGV